MAAGSAEADTHKDEIAFFLAVRVAILKMDGEEGRASSVYEIDKAIEQLINRSVASTEVIDILKASGMERPDISVLSEEFLAEIQGLKYKDLAVELDVMGNEQLRIIAVKLVTAIRDNAGVDWWRQDASV